MKRTVFLAVALLGSSMFVADAAASAAVTVEANSAPVCPNPAKLRNVCMMVSERVADNSGGHSYRYQAQFEQAACVEASDSAEEKWRKIREAWDRAGAQLRCNSLQFDVAQGHLLKFATRMLFDEFIDDAIDWGVELNPIDASDGRTVLDYLRDRIEQGRGSASEPRLRHYYDRLRQAGARHSTEL